MKRNTTTTPPKPEPRAAVGMVRCAIYTRKSTEEGLEQEFNALDAQREAGEAYIRSQTGEGWALVNERYDDGGYTGGNTDRPGLQKLMAHIDEGRIDCVVVYKVDRLSRSLLDFAQLMRTFEQRNVLRRCHVHARANERSARRGPRSRVEETGSGAARLRPRAHPVRSRQPTATGRRPVPGGWRCWRA